jgi:hypothetical protein
MAIGKSAIFKLEKMLSSRMLLEKPGLRTQDAGRGNDKVKFLGL